jgi:hypothetical protein
LALPQAGGSATQVGWVAPAFCPTFGRPIEADDRSAASGAALHRAPTLDIISADRRPDARRVASRKSERSMSPKPLEKLVLTSEFSESGILIATLSGSVSFPSVLIRFKQIIDTAAANNLRKILVNCLDTSGELSTMDKYSVSKGLIEHVRSLDMYSPAVAFVGTPPTFDGFGILVAQNLGVLAVLFHDAQSALSWLSSRNL